MLEREEPLERGPEITTRPVQPPATADGQGRLRALARKLRLLVSHDEAALRYELEEGLIANGSRARRLAERQALLALVEQRLGLEPRTAGNLRFKRQG